MKRYSLITAIMFMALAGHSEAVDRVTWKMAISRGCVRFIDYNSGTLRYYKQSRLTQDEAYAELIKGEDDPATKIMAKSTIESVYKNRNGDAARNACMDAVFAYDPDGAKTEALDKKKQEEYEIRRKAEAEWEAKEMAEKREAEIKTEEERRAAEKAEQDARDAEYEIRQARGRRERVEELRRLGINVDEKTLFGK